jgi:hypothetical protein
MHIGIFGDSFADYNNPFTFVKENESWIQQLATMTESTFECFGYSGTSVWYSFEKFKKNYKKFSHIVFCQTFQHRIHHLPNEFEGYHHMKDPLQYSFMESKTKNRMKSIIESYYTNFFNEDLDLFLAQSIFNEVNLICKQNNIKLVTLLPFEDLRYQSNYSIDVSKREGSCLLGLQHVSVDEVLVASSPNKLTSGDNRFCHLSKENNEILANIIKNEFESNQKRIFKFDVESSNDYKMFIIDKKISDRYFK